MLTSNLVIRRFVLWATTLVAAVALLPASVSAQASWPNRPIRLVDAYGAGGGSDIVARWLATRLSSRLGQSIIVENRPGAAGALAIQSVAKSAPDGYSLLLAVTSMPVSVASGNKLPFDYLKDLTPIGRIVSSPLTIVVPAESPIRSLRDLVEEARAKPGEGIRFGSSGVGSMSHIAMELLAAQTKTKMMHVPYKGTPMAVTDMLAGRLQAQLGLFASHASLLEAGKLRSLVITSSERSPFAPNVPTSAEAGYPDFVMDYWYGLMGPAGLPPEIVKRLNTEINAILAEPDTRPFLARLVATPAPSTPEEFGEVNARDVKLWSTVIKDANIRVE